MSTDGTDAAPGRRALVLLNAGSRRGDTAADAVITALTAAGLEPVRIDLREPGDIADALGRHRDTVDRVVVCGGDGTMNAALPAVLDSGLPMGVIPLGTANDFARSIGIPMDITAACRVAAADRVRRIDVGTINDRYFLNVAHIGLAVEVARRSDARSKQRLGSLAYPAAAWSAFRTRRTFVAHIRGEDGAWRRLRAIQVSVGNGRFYGGGIPVAEDAAIDDARLDLYALPAGKWHALVAMIPALRRGRMRSHREILTLSGAAFEIRTHRRKTVSVDGEEAFRTPVHLGVRPAALPVLAPGA